MLDEDIKKLVNGYLKENLKIEISTSMFLVEVRVLLEDEVISESSDSL